ncbi:phosphodiester glycosidase family protein [Arenibacter certesii]|nr:phosphodiester glycosidase family protein [Arenibacter certesii]
MRRYLLLYLLLIVCFVGCSQDNQLDQSEPPKAEEVNTVSEIISSAEWSVKKVADNVNWKYFHFDALFSSKQSITVLEVNGNPEKTIVDIPNVESGFLKTSDAAINNRAVAAINGSYFDTKNGGSTVFFKKAGEIKNETRSGFNWYRENAGLGIDAAGKISIIRKPASGWRDVEGESLLVSGPLLMMDGEILSQDDNKFNNNRHPRTAIGVTADNRILAVVVDGRASQAQGASVEEMAIIMEALGCRDAMNLDGGGSSTAWVKNYGVVNYPSDNKKFDHEGERGVATVITFSNK